VKHCPVVCIAFLYRGYVGIKYSSQTNQVVLVRVIKERAGGALRSKLISIVITFSILNYANNVPVSPRVRDTVIFLSAQVLRGNSESRWWLRCQHTTAACR